MKQHFSNSHSFTLSELLVSVAIISTIAALLLSSLGRVQVWTLKSRATSNLHQAGVAIHAYANEHNGRLPGPAPLGVYPFYDKQGATLGYALGGCLSTYLGLPDPNSLPKNTKVMIPALLSPGIAKLMANPDSVPNYIQNTTLTNINIGGRPFGILASGAQPEVLPMTVFDIANAGGASQVWALTDIDQQTTDGSARASGWFSSLPAKPVYKDCRLRLYFDAHVEAVSLTATNY